MNLRHASLPVILALGLSARFANASPPTPSTSQTELTLAVTGHAESPPDRTIATLAVQVQADTAAAAQDSVNRAMRAALAAAAPIPDLQATTGAYSVYPDDPKRGTWQARQTLTLRLAAAPGTAKAGTLRHLIGTLQAKGILLEDISGGLSRAATRRTRGKAIADAVAQMRAEAEAAAAALGVKVSAVSKMNLGMNNPFPPRPMMMAARIATASPQVKSGPIDETVSLSATVRLGSP